MGEEEDEADDRVLDTKNIVYCYEMKNNIGSVENNILVHYLPSFRRGFRNSDLHHMIYVAAARCKSYDECCRLQVKHR